MRITGTSREELETYRDARLRSLLVHAYERVPYYRKLFDRHRLHPRHIRGAVDLELIPITTKQDLRGLPAHEILASGMNLARLLSVRTSGSTGEPFTIRRTWLEDKRQYLLRLRALRSLGMRIGDCKVSEGVAWTFLRSTRSPLNRHPALRPARNPEPAGGPPCRGLRAAQGWRGAPAAAR